MRTADNQLGFNVERHDGAKVGWFAIAGPFETAGLARDHMRNLGQTPGAEYRIYAALACREGA